MKPSYFFYLIVFCCIVNIAFAQQADYSFKVLGNKGENTVDDAPIKIGMKITAKQKIKIVDGGYLGLAHANGSTTELKKEGIYTVKELESKLKIGQTNVFTNLLNYISAELTSISENETRAVRAGRMTHKSAAVSRATDGAETENGVVVMLPKNVHATINDKITIKWFNNSDKPIENYKLTIRSYDGEILTEKILKDTSFTFSFASKDFKDQVGILYTVTDAKDTIKNATEYSIARLRASEIAEIEKDLAQLPNYKSTLTNLILARYFEEKMLYANAYYLYDEALKTADADEYKELYLDYLFRNNFYK
jgi:hypothetical protein